MGMNLKKDSKCWWCGAEANSREHAIKKTDIKRVYGNPPYSNQNQPFVASGPNKRFKVQEPNSKKVKFNLNLCSECNNSRSSSFDRAYDKFVVNVLSKNNQQDRLEH